MSELMSTPSEAAKAEAAKQAVILLFMIIGILVVMALQQPDFLRTWRMRLAAASRQLLSWLARKAGHTSMGIELSTGTQAYSLPYLLSKMRDRAKDMYDKSGGQ